MLTVIRCILFFFISIGGLFSCSISKEESKQIDFEEIDSLFNLYKEYVFQHPDSVIHLLSICQQQENDSLSWYYWKAHIGQCCFFADRQHEALACNDSVQRFCENSLFSSHVATIQATNYNYRAVILQANNERDSALNCLIQAYRLMQQASMRREIPNICVNAADICRQQGRLPQASEWYYRAIQAADSLQLHSMKFCLAVGMGQVYSDLHNFSLAQHYFSLADSLYSPKDAYERFHYYNSRGNCYYFEKKYKEALLCFRKAYEVVRPFRQRSAEAIVEANQGEVFLFQGQLDSARYYIDKANEYFGKDAKADDAIGFYVNGLYASLALEENNLSVANRYLSVPYNFSRIGPTYLYLHHKRLMEYYEKKGEFGKAFEYQRMVTAYDDSLRNELYLNSIAEIDFRYRRDTTLLKHEVVIANSQSKVSHLQTIVVISISSLFCLILLAFAAYWYILRKNERRRQQQVRLVTTLRMENVRNRFSPHFVFNVLNVVVSSLRQYENITLPLRLLVQVLRSNLLISGKMSISLEEEISMTKNYLELRRSMNPEITPPLEWEIGADVNLSFHLPSMMIQIPVENAIKHAFPAGTLRVGGKEGNLPSLNGQACAEEPFEQPLIQVKILNEGDSYIRIIIEDNGVGYCSTGTTARQPGNNDTGNGIRILFRTVQLLNTCNIQKIHFEITDRSIYQKREHGTRVMILLPHSYNYEI